MSTEGITGLLGCLGLFCIRYIPSEKERDYELDLGGEK